MRLEVRRLKFLRLLEIMVSFLDDVSIFTVYGSLPDENLLLFCFYINLTSPSDTGNEALPPAPVLPSRKSCIVAKPQRPSTRPITDK